MEFAILIYESERDRAIRLENGDEQTRVTAAYEAYTEALVAAGVMRGGQRLSLPMEAITVAPSDRGEPVVHDGPFADTKEQLGGFYIIEVIDHDEAVEWALRCPASRRGRAEVRPIL